MVPDGQPLSPGGGDAGRQSVQGYTSDTRQGSRSTTGSDGADHGAEIQSMSQVETPHELRLTTTDGEEIAGLVPGGRVVSQEKKWGLYFLYLRHHAPGAW